MQIPISSAATAAAGNVSQATSKDRLPGTAAGDSVTSPTSQTVERVAKSEEMSADRDANGGGDGPLGRRTNHASPSAHDAHNNPAFQNLPVSNFDPPSELDIVG